MVPTGKEWVEVGNGISHTTRPYLEFLIIRP